jgi:hypothetical protein
MSGAEKKKSMKGGNESLLNKQVIRNVLENIQRIIPTIKDPEIKKQKIRSFEKFIKKYENNPVLQEPEIQKLISSISNNAQESINKKIETFKSMNNEQKNANYNLILKKLQDTYRNQPILYNVAKLTRLANIGSRIESINRIKTNNKKNLLKALKNTIKQKEISLGEYPEFQKYKITIEQNEI